MPLRKIYKSKGLINIQDLCEQSGYSKRYLDLRFADHVGVGPKVLTRIVRFVPLFRSYLGRDGHGALRGGLADQYYDQSHFIWEFRRFTGRSPGGPAQKPIQTISLEVALLESGYTVCSPTTDHTARGFSGKNGVHLLFSHPFQLLSFFGLVRRWSFGLVLQKRF